MLLIRSETPADHGAIRRVNELAFGGTTEAELVERLRNDAGSCVSLVAEDAGRLAGHAFFSPVRLLHDAEERHGMGLGPMAVEPSHQHRGIGTALVERGLEICRSRGVGFVVVLGHPGYYPRFGFVPASRHHVRSEYDVPDEVFMVLELTRGALSGGGVVRYHSAFQEVDPEGESRA